MVFSSSFALLKITKWKQPSRPLQVLHLGLDIFAFFSITPGLAVAPFESHLSFFSSASLKWSYERLICTICWFVFFGQELLILGFWRTRIVDSTQIENQHSGRRMTFWKYTFPFCWSETTKWVYESTKWEYISTKWATETAKGVTETTKWESKKQQSGQRVLYQIMQWQVTESIIRYSCSSANSVITYNYLLISEGDAGTLDISSGVWTTNVPGLCAFYRTQVSLGSGLWVPVSLCHSLQELCETLLMWLWLMIIWQALRSMTRFCSTVSSKFWRLVGSFKSR